MKQRDTVIFDIDGVLCDNSQELHEFIQTKPTEERWESEWFPSMRGHKLHRGWWTINRLMWPTAYLILLTNRPERFRDITVDWLEEHEVGYDKLVMRPTGTPYSQGKRERLEALLTEHNVVLAIDDDAMQVAVFKDAGIPVIHAYNGLDATFEGTL